MFCPPPHRQAGVWIYNWIGPESLSHKSVVKGGRRVKITFHGNKLVHSKLRGNTINTLFLPKTKWQILTLTYEIMIFES